MAWVKTDLYNLPFRAKIFFLPGGRLMEDSIPFYDALNGNDAEAAERVALALLQQHRPELTGATVLCIHMNAERYTWEFIIQHGSFPPHPVGEELQREPLIPGCVADEDYSWRKREPLL